jgi:ABC-2 type transport system permease protein
MLLAGVIARGRNKTVMNILGIVIFMGVYFGFQYFVLFKMPQDEANVMQFLATMNYNLALAASRNFPPSFWATLAVAENFNAVGLRYFAMFVGISIVGVAAMGFVGSRYYYSVLMSGGETSTKRRTVVDDGMWNKLQQGDPISTIAAKDHKVLLRTSSYLMNCGTLPLIWPGLLLMYSLFGKNIASSAPEDQLIQFLATINVPWIKTIGLMLLTQMVTTGSMIGATGFSREGHSLAITKALPISGRNVVFAKIRYALLFQLVTSIPMMAVGQYLFKLPVGYAFVALLVGHIGGLWSIFGGILIDVMRPYLNWTDPTRAVKQNINALVPMFGGWGILFAQGYAAYRMYLAGWGGWLPIGLIAGFNVLLAAVTFTALMANAEKRYNMIEL